MVGHDLELIAKHIPQDELEPYERLLHEAMLNESAHFARQDAVEEAWRIVNPILGNATPLLPYDPGTWGPPESADLLTGYTSWHAPQLAAVPA